VDLFLEENTGKRAAILDFMGCQRAHSFGPGEIATGQIGPWKRPGSLWDIGLPKEALVLSLVGGADLPPLPTPDLCVPLCLNFAGHFLIYIKQPSPSWVVGWGWRGSFLKL